MFQETFNDQFPSWEKEYNKLQNEKKIAKDEQDKQFRMVEFQKAYPTLSFNDLKLQNDNYSTDDGCVHYKHVINSRIYSWNYMENEWEQNWELSEMSNLFTD